MKKKFNKPRLPSKSKQKLTDNRKTSVSSPLPLQKIMEKYRPEFFGKIYLLLDCSGSMSSKNKLTQAINGTIGFSKEAIKQGYHVGLIIFADSAELLISPKNDIDQIQKHVKAIKAFGSTNLTDALQIAINHLKNYKGEKIICVVTDGMPNNAEAAIEKAKIAHESGVDIIVIATDDADREFLEKLSNRKELITRVEDHQLESGIKEMAKLLPKKSS
ncbi:vWA domain-containing protein [Calditrichota bacterium LG25]